MWKIRKKYIQIFIDNTFFEPFTENLQNNAKQSKTIAYRPIIIDNEKESKKVKKKNGVRMTPSNAKRNQTNRSTHVNVTKTRDKNTVKKSNSENHWHNQSDGIHTE